MPPKRDRFTFQFSELRTGRTPAIAVATVSRNFVHSYHDSKHYEVLLSAMLSRFAEKKEDVDVEAFKALKAALSDRVNAILADQRSKDKDRKNKWVGKTVDESLYNDHGSDDEGETDGPLTAEERAARKAELDEAQRRLEEEHARIAEREEVMRKQRLENERLLRARSRRVDATAFEEKLKQEGAVLLNSGIPSKKGGRGGKGGGKDPQLSPEEMIELTESVNAAVKEKERLKTACGCSDEDLPAQIEEAKKELAEAEKAGAGLPAEVPSKSVDLNKGQIKQLQEKLNKQNMEKTRFAMQLKTMEANPQRDELIAVLEKRDAIMLRVERAQN